MPVERWKISPRSPINCADLPILAQPAASSTPGSLQIMNFSLYALRMCVESPSRLDLSRRKPHPSVPVCAPRLTLCFPRRSLLCDTFFFLLSQHILRSAVILLFLVDSHINSPSFPCASYQYHSNIFIFFLRLSNLVFASCRVIHCVLLYGHVSQLLCVGQLKTPKDESV